MTLKTTTTTAAAAAAAESVDTKGGSSKNPFPGGGRKASSRRAKAEGDATGPMTFDEEEMEGDGRAEFYGDKNAPIQLDRFAQRTEEETGALFLGGTDEATFSQEEFHRIYLFQLPTVLPTLPLRPGDGSTGGGTGTTVKMEGGGAAIAVEGAAAAGAVKPEDNGEDKDDAGGAPTHVGSARRRLRAFGSGRVGKLQVHASGKATLILGGCLYEVAPGMLAAFQQELAVIDASKALAPPDSSDADVEGLANAMTFLGPVRLSLISKAGQ